MIAVKNLTFIYDDKYALKDVSFEIKKGTITALVGPNGAGKTTLLRCLAALEEPFSGSILMDNEDIYINPRNAHRKIGFLSDSFGLYENLTVRQCLEYAAMSREVPIKLFNERVALYSEKLELSKMLDLQAGKLSRGQKQRAALLQSIIHQPSLLLLDEPASGLDPEARQSLASLFNFLRSQGMTLVVSSHILAELEEYSTDLLILKHGEIIQQSGISSRSDEVCISLRVVEQISRVEELLLAEPNVRSVDVSDGEIIFKYSNDENSQAELLKRLIEANVKISFFGEVKNNLQDAYLKTVKSKSQDEHE